MSRRRHTAVGTLSYWWGVGGIALLLAWALYRLLPHALASLSYQWEWWQWVCVGLWCVFMLISEGYDGFQKRLVPRIYERAHMLRQEGRIIERVLAPAFCLNYLHAPRRRMIVAYTALALIICAVAVVHSLPQPLRGMIDWGVVMGLTYGLGVLLLGLPGYCQRQRV